MKRLLFLLLALSSPALAAPDDCFLLVRLDARGQQVVAQTHPERLSQRFQACSTFKVAAAVMAYDRGLLPPGRVFHWDGHDHGRAACNRDQSARSWIVDSVVWVTQVLMGEIGEQRVRRYLVGFRYGTADTSSGLTRFWLNGDDGRSGSLKISAREQVAFLARLWRDQLPVSASAQANTRRLIAASDGLDGKTGTGYLDGSRRQIGWFVGHVRRGGHDYVLAYNYSERLAGETHGYAGLESRRRVLARLEQQLREKSAR